MIVYLASPQDLFCKCQMIKIRDKPLFRDKINRMLVLRPNSNPFLRGAPFSRRNGFVISSDPVLVFSQQNKRRVCPDWLTFCSPKYFMNRNPLKWNLFRSLEFRFLRVEARSASAVRMSDRRTIIRNNFYPTNTIYQQN